MIELILAKLFDEEELSDTEDLPEIMLGFFDYVVRTDLGEVIYFTDYAEKPDKCNSPVRIFDPVNHQNNVGAKYSIEEKNCIVKAATEAGDAVEAGLKAPTKELTMRILAKSLWILF